VTDVLSLAKHREKLIKIIAAVAKRLATTCFIFIDMYYSNEHFHGFMEISVKGCSALVICTMLAAHIRVYPVPLTLVNSPVIMGPIG
jgi:hypothetical protein